jgi:phosphoribosyl 1,2-cyclic phosphodiesterase
MKFSCLASGSSGNCFYVENNNQAILIDAGLSAKQAFQRLDDLNLEKNKIKAIFISHEHTDHIKGADVLSRSLNIPIFATKGTVKNSFLSSNDNLINPIKSSESISIAGLEVESIPKSHDAAEPVSFIIRNKKTLSILTDIGYSCKNISRAINESDFLVMEANHDINMLENGPYPWDLKKRVLSDKGHISNLHSALSVLENSHKKLESITLAHLSKTNNTKELAKATFKKFLKERKDLSPEIFVSMQSSATPIISCL